MPKIYFSLLTLFCLSALPSWAQTVFVGDTICAGDSSYVYVIPDSGRTYTWYDASTGGTQIGTGDTLWTGALTTTTTFYAQGLLPGSAAYQVGPANNSIAGGSNYTYQPDGCVFSVQSTVTIDTVFVYPNGPGNVVINIENSSQTNIFSTTVPVTTTGKTAIPVGYTVAPGTGYRMHNVGSTVGGLFRNTGGAQYPYTSVPLNITGAINTSTSFYYKFYDWRLSAGPAPDPRVGVTVTVNQPPAFNLGPDVNLCAGAAVTFNDPPGLSCVWSNGSTGPVTTLDSAGVYTVICTDTNSCSSSDTIELIAVTPYVAGLQQDTTVCAGTPVTICAVQDSNITYNWSNGSATACTMDSTAGVFTLLALDNFGCSYFDTTEVIHQQAPTSDWSVDSTACPTFQFMDLSSDAPSGWAWDFGDGANSTMQSPSHTYTSNGTYMVTLVADNNCGADTLTVPITVACLVGRPDPATATLDIFPNPGNGQFSIVSDATPIGETRLTIWAPDGRLVRDLVLPATGNHLNTTVDLQGEAAGIYLLRLATDQGASYAKLQVIE